MEFALCHNTNPVGKLFRFLEVLRAHDNRPPLLDVPDQLPNLATGLDIEARGRLIQNDELGLGNDGHSEGELTLHPSAELADLQ